MNLDRFHDFSDTARVWLYQTDRTLSDQEINLISIDMNQFVGEWAAHGNKLLADAQVLNPYFIVFVVQDDETLPSGCSIDSSVRFIKEIGGKYKIDFFNRLNLYILEKNEIHKKHISELTKLDRQELIFDPLINHLGKLRHNWPIPLESSSYEQLAMI